MPNPKKSTTPIPHFRRNVALHITDGVLFFFAMTFISYEEIIPVFFKQLGATNLIIALIPFLRDLGMSLPSLISANIVRRVPRKKPFVLLFGLGQRLPWIAAGLAALFASESHPNIVLITLLVVILVVNTSSGLVVPPWFDLIAKTVPVSFRGRLFSIRGAGSYLLGILGGVVVRILLRQAGYPLNFSMLFGIGIVFLMTSYIAAVFIKEPDGEIDRRGGTLFDYIRQFPVILNTNKAFTRFTIARAFFMLSFASTSFYAVYTLAKFDLDPSYTGIFIVLTAITFIIANPLLGVLADRIGHKMNFVIATGALALGSVLALFVGYQFVLFSLFVLAAIAKSVKMMSSLPMTVEFCSDEERPTYLAVSALILTPASLLALVMGYLADHFGYHILFAIALGSSLVSFILFQWVIEEPRNGGHGKQPKEPADGELTP